MLKCANFDEKVLLVNYGAFINLNTVQLKVGNYYVTVVGLSQSTS